MKRWKGAAMCAGLLAAAMGCGGGGKKNGRGDAGTDDATPGDARRDTGPVECDLANPCDPDDGCDDGLCLSERRQEIGSDSDPISGYDGSVELVSFKGGYCSASCDPNDRDACGGCGACVGVGNQNVCFRTCEPKVTEQTCPGEAQTCDLIDGVCAPFGCEGDAECALYRADTNDNGEIDPYDPEDNPDGDRLAYDTTGKWKCNTTTARCEHSGTSGVSAGAPCDKATDCEKDGVCRISPNGNFCSKNACDLEGRECAGTGRCHTRAFGFPACLKPCVIAVDAPADQCPTGFQCVWTGEEPEEERWPGGCIPGNFNEVSAPNVGAACDDDAECWSPNGAGQCLDAAPWAPPGYCTVVDCDLPPAIEPDETCGNGAQCVGVADSDATFCMKSCSAATNCSAGYGCWPTADIEQVGLNIRRGSKVCAPGCLTDSHCRPGETCEGVTSTRIGECSG